MAALRDQLHAGIEHLRHNQYAQAASSLEAFLKQTEPNSKPYLQAQMHLVQAYQGNGQPERASSLCRLLTTSKNPQVREWAQQGVKTLSKSRLASIAVSSDSTQAVVPPVPENVPAQATPKVTDSLGTQSTEAVLKSKKRLIALCLERGQSKRAIALCLTLATSDNPQVQQWAKQMIRELSAPPLALPPASSPNLLPHGQQDQSPQASQQDGYSTDYLKGTAMEKIVSKIMKKDTVIL